MLASPGDTRNIPWDHDTWTGWISFEGWIGKERVHFCKLVKLKKPTSHSVLELLAQLKNLISLGYTVNLHCETVNAAYWAFKGMWAQWLWKLNTHLMAMILSNLCIKYLKAKAGRPIGPADNMAWTLPWLSVWTMTESISSMVTGWPPVRKLLCKPSKSLALKQSQRQEICSYLKPAVILLLHPNNMICRKKYCIYYFFVCRCLQAENDLFRAGYFFSQTFCKQLDDALFNVGKWTEKGAAGWPQWGHGFQ